MKTPKRKSKQKDEEKNKNKDETNRRKLKMKKGEETKAENKTRQQTRLYPSSRNSTVIMTTMIILEKHKAK